jgi:hypothetical protein
MKKKPPEIEDELASAMKKAILLVLQDETADHIE